MLADLVAAGLGQLSVSERQLVLETLDVEKRLEVVAELVFKASKVQRLSKEINSKMQKRTEDELRETVLKRQLQELKRELRKLKGGLKGIGFDDEEGDDADEEE